MIETKRMKLYPASKERMERLIASQTDYDLKAAYGEMLSGCLAYPDRWEWYAPWMMELPDGTCVGDLSFKGLNGDASAEIGYGVAEAYRCKGYATEAVDALVKWAFHKPGVLRVTAEAEETNAASRRVLQKAGFSPTGERGKEGLLYVRHPKRAIIYIHGKNGSATEAEHYKPLFPGDTVIGFDYKSETPWEAQKEFPTYFDTVSCGFEKVRLIANSIGAYFSLCSLGEKKIDKAFFISPIVDMEKLISDMMMWGNVTEAELQRKGEIPTASGETLSWEYLQWVHEHPVKWSIPTEILFGTRDALQQADTVRSFAHAHGAGMTVMENGEHWFHTREQMAFLDAWLLKFREDRQ